MNTPKYPAGIRRSASTSISTGIELFVNPLMSMYFAVDLGCLARRNLYLDRLEGTMLMRQVSGVIETFRYELRSHRPGRQYPH